MIELFTEQLSTIVSAMQEWLIRVFAAVAIVTWSPNNAAAALSCSPGFVPQGDDCVCGDWPNGIIICDEDSKKASMQIGYCMTYSNETGEVKAGTCPQSFFRNDSYKFYYSLPSEVFDLNDRVCSPSNSQGLLCGECQDGFAVSSTNIVNCINCTGVSDGWIKKIAIRYLPITLFFCATIVFSISIVSGPINLVIFFGQATTSCYDVAFIVSALGSQGTSTYSNRASTTTVAAIYDLFNLRVLRSLIPPLCMTDHLTRLQAFSLESAAAFYPLIIILLFYICIQLHVRNFRPVVYCWRPFLKCFLHIRRSIDPKTSIIDAFATFIHLSYVKIMFVAGTILTPSILYNRYGHKLSTLVLYISTDIQFFHKKHLPYAIPSIFILLTFTTLPPIVLTFYQSSLFQKCLSRCKMNSQALRTFVETFQGCYKDGITSGTRDCRYFAGLYFILRIIIATLSFANVELFTLGCSALYWCAALLFAFVKPYKNSFYNFTDAVILGLLGTIYTFLIFNGAYVFFTGHASIFLLVLTDILYTIPLLYLVLFVVYWVVNRKTNCMQRLKDLFQQTINDNFDIAHRLQNPEEYEELTRGNNVQCPEPLKTEHSSNTYGSI